MRVLIIVSLIVFIIDQLTKFYIKKVLYLYQSIEIIKDVFYITYVQNSGISFGMLGGIDSEIKRWILVVIIGIAIVLITYYWFKNKNQNLFYNTGCGMILGGAFGNFMDRLLMGKVVDFIDVGYKSFRWPVFNMADTFISIGIGILILYLIFIKKGEF